MFDNNCQHSNKTYCDANRYDALHKKVVSKGVMSYIVHNVSSIQYQLWSYASDKRLDKRCLCLLANSEAIAVKVD